MHQSCACRGCFGCCAGDFALGVVCVVTPKRLSQLQSLSWGGLSIISWGGIPWLSPRCLKVVTWLWFMVHTDGTDGTAFLLMPHSTRRNGGKIHPERIARCWSSSGTLPASLCPIPKRTEHPLGTPIPRPLAEVCPLGRGCGWDRPNELCFGATRACTKPR